MRITEIEIKNFRAFYDTYKIDLASLNNQPYRAGYNLLVYGENGSGKSSLFLGLKLFLESGLRQHPFEPYQNIFLPNDDGYLKLHLRPDRNSAATPYEWSKTITTETNTTVINDASKTKGFFDYKGLLETYFLHRDQPTVNLFKLLVENILANSINDITTRTFAEDWADVQAKIPQRNTQRQITILQDALNDFNTGLTTKLQELQQKAAEILVYFGYRVELDFAYRGLAYQKQPKDIIDQNITLRIKFFDRDLSAHHLFLNEARLSAIALSLYFASSLISPTSQLKVLALDDMLIGLDMSNRLPVIDILKDHFADWQIFFFTYDQAWYEIVKQRTQTPDWSYRWKFVEFYSTKTEAYEIPVYVENKAYLDKAKEYFQAHDYKACVIYLRTAFEVILKTFCERKNLKVKYRQNPKKLTSEDFWSAVVSGRKRDGTPFLDQAFINDVQLYRSLILNPLSHAQIAVTPQQEIADAITTIENLEQRLTATT
jgi:energy-coupling factor transporter ATP-binding protein EcfA2